MRGNGQIIERPQYMFMRVALGIHGEDVESAIETYDMMSTKRFIHASPTLFHAGTFDAQLSSCYLLPVGRPKVEDMYKTITDCAVISRYAGGIGLDVADVTAAGYESC